jgi:hypothetical protein
MTNGSTSKKRLAFAGALCVASGSVGGCGAADDADIETVDDSVAAVAGCTPLAVTGVKASGDDGNVPKNAIDGKLGTRWSSLGKGEWIRLDLGSVQKIGAVAIAWYKGDQRKSTVSIEMSQDASAWSKVWSGKSSGATTSLEEYAVAGHGRYVRVRVDGNTQNDWASITEITVCGDGGGGDPGDGGNDPDPPSCGGGPSVDKNGVAYVALPGFSYVGGKERFDWKENFKSNGSMRHDFSGTAEGNQCALGYFVVEGPNDEELSIKLGGGPHNDDNPEYADTYDFGVTNFAGNKSRLRFEKTHPDYSDSIPGLSFSFGSVENKWVGVMACKLNLDDNADSQVDKIWTVAWVDPQGLDAQGKPKNAWTKVFDKKLSLGEVKLKSPTEPYVATIGKPQLAQATVRIDEQDEGSYEHKYVAYRSPVACK